MVWGVYYESGQPILYNFRPVSRILGLMLNSKRKYFKIVFYFKGIIFTF